MERRTVRRVKRRITCEFFQEDRDYKGIVLDLDLTGLFIRTNATIPPGVEIDIHMAASAAAPAMTVRARVARRRSVPANLTSIINRGLGVQILEAPAEYGLLLGFGKLDSPIRNEFSSNTTMHRSNFDSADPAASQPNSPAATRKESLPIPSTPHDLRVPRRPTPSRRPGKASGPTIGCNADRSSRKPRPSATAVLVGGDELNEIADVLVEFGVEVIHREPTDPEFAVPSGARLLVVSARLALEHTIPVGRPTTVSIAVCDDASKTIRSMLEKRGFQYLLRQPVHGEALRLLFRYALFDQPDRRTQTRLPFGYAVSWRVGWRRERGSLLEISLDGCRLLAADALPLDTRIRIKIPSEVAGGRTLRLHGTVIRCSARGSRDRLECVDVGVVFDDLTPKLRDQLTRFHDLWSAGPPVLKKTALTEAAGSEPDQNIAAVKTREESEFPGSQPPIVEEAIDQEAIASEAIDVAPATQAADEEGRDEKWVDVVTDESAPASTDRRQNPRGRWNQEIVEVDAEQHVVQALLGRDLSMGGVRIDPQAGLDSGDPLQIAIFDTTRREPLILHAIVARDDERAGMGLHFVDLSEETAARLAEMIAALPAVESLGSSGTPSAVPAGILSNSDQNPSPQSQSANHTK